MFFRRSFLRRISYLTIGVTTALKLAMPWCVGLFFFRETEPEKTFLISDDSGNAFHAAATSVVSRFSLAKVWKSCKIRLNG